MPADRFKARILISEIKVFTALLDYLDLINEFVQNLCKASYAPSTLHFT
jgi:hypothetical protein